MENAIVQRSFFNRINYHLPIAIASYGGGGGGNDPRVFAIGIITGFFLRHFAKKWNEQFK